MVDIHFSAASSVKSQAWVNQACSWNDFLARLQAGAREITSITQHDYLDLEKSAQFQYKDGTCFVGGHLEGGRRTKDSVLDRSLVTLDVDYCDSDQFDALLDHWPAFSGLMYSTISCPDTGTSFKLRLVIPLVEPVAPEDYEPVARWVASQIPGGLDLFDDSTFQAERAMYLPTFFRDGGNLWFEVFEGAPVDARRVLSDVARSDLLGLVSSRVAEKTAPGGGWSEGSFAAKAGLARKAPDPRHKEGIIGAFCSQYSVTRVLQEFLSSIYKPFSRDRYTFVQGSSAGGLAVFQDLHAFSFHSTDPAATGHLVNAFDLCQIHLHGGSFEACLEWARGLVGDLVEERGRVRVQERVKASTPTGGEGSRENPAPGQPDASKVASDPVEALTDWTSELHLTDKGFVSPKVFKNYEIIMRCDPNLQNICYNKFFNQLWRKGPVPWQSEPGEWRDSDETRLGMYLEETYNLPFQIRKVQHMVDLVVDMPGRDYDPLRAFLEDLPEWDGVERAESLLVDYLGADDSDFTRQVTRKTLLAGVRRIYDPGAKFDQMLVLSGAQGIGKSTLWSRLAGEFFTDSLTLGEMGSKAGAEKVSRHWILEVAELAGMSRADEQAVKAFLSTQKDVFRPAYGRNVVTLPRRSIVVGTVNSDNFLRDTTGNRRFWPVRCSGESSLKPWDLDSTTVRQIWSEVLGWYKQGESLVLSYQLAAETVQRQEAALEETPFDDAVTQYLEYERPDDWDHKTVHDRRLYFEQYPEPGRGRVARSVCVREIWEIALGNDRGRLTRRDHTLIVLALQKAGFTKAGRVRLPGFGRVFEFVRKE